MRTVVDKWREEGIQQGVQKGIQQGILKGIKEGFYKGAVEEARDLILEALETRFGTVKPHIFQSIKAIEDRHILKSLHRAVILAGSIEEFEEKLKSHVQ
jgi:flagellar biosynthesis/type III secretory pathway protein FliH